MEQAAQEAVSGLEQDNQKAEKGTPTQAAMQTALNPPPSGRKKEKVTPQSAPSVKSWTSPGKNSLSLSDGGVRLSSGSGISVSLTNMGVNLVGKDISIEGDAVHLGGGKKVQIQAKRYVSLECMMNLTALFPTEVQIASPKTSLYCCRSLSLTYV